MQGKLGAQLGAQLPQQRRVCTGREVDVLVRVKVGGARTKQRRNNSRSRSPMTETNSPTFALLSLFGGLGICRLGLSDALRQLGSNDR